MDGVNWKNVWSMTIFGAALLFVLSLTLTLNGCENPACTDFDPPDYCDTIKPDTPQDWWGGPDVDINIIEDDKDDVNDDEQDSDGDDSGDGSGSGVPDCDEDTDEPGDSDDGDDDGEDGTGGTGGDDEGGDEDGDDDDSSEDGDGDGSGDGSGSEDDETEDEDEPPQTDGTCRRGKTLICAFKRYEWCVRFPRWWTVWPWHYSGECTRVHRHDADDDDEDQDED